MTSLIDISFIITMGFFVAIPVIAVIGNPIKSIYESDQWLLPY